MRHAREQPLVAGALLVLVALDRAERAAGLAAQLTVVGLAEQQPGIAEQPAVPATGAVGFAGQAGSPIWPYLALPA